MDYLTKLSSKVKFMENNLVKSSTNFYKPNNTYRSTKSNKNFSDLNLTERNSLNTTKKSVIFSPNIEDSSVNNTNSKQRRRSHLSNPNGGVNDDMQA